MLGWGMGMETCKGVVEVAGRLHQGKSGKIHGYDGVQVTWEGIARREGQGVNFLSLIQYFIAEHDKNIL